MWDFNLNLVNVPFDLGYTLDSGQTFRWSLRDDTWYGVVGGGVLKVRQEGFTLFCSSSSEHLDSRFVHDYFRLGDDFGAIMASIPKDDAMTEAFERYRGLRLIRQDVWECLVSFVIATNTNIPRIRGMVSNLCDRFGDRVNFESLDYSLFPSPEQLASASVEDLTACGLGYRAKFVRDISWTVDSGFVNLDELRLQDYSRAKEILRARPREEDLSRHRAQGRRLRHALLLRQGRGFPHRRLDSQGAGGLLSAPLQRGYNGETELQGLGEGLAL